MKKVFTILLTLVMAVTLINLNNSHTKAEGNDTVTVTFDMQDHGTQIQAQTIGEGECATKPTDPTAQGYTFGGWYQEAACTNAWDFSTPVATDKTLYAKWTADPFTITAVEGNTTVRLIHSGVYAVPALEYSINDGATWQDCSYGSGIALTKGQRVLFKIKADATEGGLSAADDKYVYVDADNKIAASGNVMSLVRKSYNTATTLPSDYAFAYLFKDCAYLTSIDGLILPATTLTANCYKDMFINCENLTSIPVDLLPAKTLVANCYNGMFYGCTNLTNIPNLPATKLADSCYAGMFKYCSNIKVSATKTGNYVIPFKVTNTGATATDPTKEMFKNTGGTLIGDPEIGTTYYIATKSSQKSEECTGTSACSVSATKGTENIVAHITGATGDPSPSDVITVLQFGEGAPKTLIKGIDYDLYTGSLTFVFNKSFIDTLDVGTHSIKISYMKDSYGYIYSLNITIAGDSPSPSKKDESCEKVIGPTWHWNNDKGICEDYGVVGTATR